MNEIIRWPGGDFTIQEAVELNPTVPQPVLRQKLADAMAAKKIVQTKKGDGKIKGTFKTADAVPEVAGGGAPPHPSPLPQGGEGTANGGT